MGEKRTLNLGKLFSGKKKANKAANNLEANKKDKMVIPRDPRSTLGIKRNDGTYKYQGGHIGGNLGFNDQAIFTPRRKKWKGIDRERKRLGFAV